MPVFGTLDQEREMIGFIAHGVPAPQGSKNQFGGESNPRTKPWRAAVTAEAAAAMEGRELFSGPVMVRVVFQFPRPKAHFRTGKNAHLLRDDAPLYFSDKTPDLDKLQRAIGDALTGVVFRDDKQIAWWDTRKVYGDRGLARISVVSMEVGES
jgi:Holliday junction resolvase RusA-like endonuclease